MKVTNEGDYGLAIAAWRQQTQDLTDWMLAQGIPPVSIAHMFGDLCSVVMAERVRRFRLERIKADRENGSPTLRG